VRLGVVDRVGGPVALAWAGLLLLAEGRWPLRPRVRPRRQRLVTNGAVALVAGVVERLAVLPVVAWTAVHVEHAGLGAAPLVPGPPWLRTVVALLVLDYTLYVWHRLNHTVPLLWRFHSVHHTDLDLDASTAVRFHAGEMVATVAVRAAQIAVAGAGPWVALAYEGVMQAATLFHHANVRLPLGLERRLQWLVVTPRMHGIHHSIEERETSSNWSVVLSIWDRLHGTLRLAGQERPPTIGLPAYRDPAELGFARLMAMPFERQRPSFIGGGPPAEVTP